MIDDAPEPVDEEVREYLQCMNCGSYENNGEGATDDEPCCDCGCRALTWVVPEW